MSIRLSNTGCRQRLVKSAFSYGGDLISITHYVTSSGVLAPAYYNFRNQRPSLIEGQLPKTAQIGALVDDAMYYVSITVHLNKFSGMDVNVGFALVVPNSDYRVGMVDTVPLKSLVPDISHTAEHVRKQVVSVLRGWSEGDSIWICINNWLKEHGYLEAHVED